MDGYNMADDLMEEKYQSNDVIQENNSHIVQVLYDFLGSISLEDAWHGGQERDFPWGAIRTMDDLMGDLHLEDRGFLRGRAPPGVGAQLHLPRVRRPSTTIPLGGFPAEPRLLANTTTRFCAANSALLAPN